MDIVRGVFKDICDECLGPMSRSVVVRQISTCQAIEVLKEIKMSALERSLVKTAECLVDCRTSFMLLSVDSLEIGIRYQEVMILSSKLEDFELKMVSKSWVDKGAAIPLARTFLLTRYSETITSKFLSILSKLLPYINESTRIPRPHFIYLSQTFEVFNGSIIRGQCTHIHNQSFTHKSLAILKSVNFMTTSYLGALEPIYSQSLRTQESLFDLLKNLHVSVLIAPQPKAWISDACRNSATTLILSPNPDDLTACYSSWVFNETQLFYYAQCSGEVKSEAQVTYANFWVEKEEKVSVILPENLGREYERSILQVIELWEQWRKDYLVINAGLWFESEVYKWSGGKFAEVMLRFIRRFIGKLVNSNEVYRRFLAELNEKNSVWVSVDAGFDVKVKTENERAYQTESLAVRLKGIKKVIEYLLQITRVDFSTNFKELNQS